jgi:xanthine dehydrogenase YagR molybdenum-binding subunit
MAAGKIINPNMARSQISGSMVWDISKALHEETFIDEKPGKYMNTSFKRSFVKLSN